MDVVNAKGEKRKRSRFLVLAGVFAFMLTAGFSSAQAATLCVNEKPSSGCYSTIQDAVNAAASGDTIEVAPGIYKEYVQITQPVSLVGAGPNVSIIDATGKYNAIYVNGTSDVVVTGFTLENAQYEGILVRDSSDVTVWGNKVMNNDKNLVPGTTSSTVCTDLTTVYPFEINEQDDCGEGVHLLGSNHSSVYDNTIEYNAGGVLLTDDDAPNDNNSVRDNTVRDNVYDCGVTLASHGSWGVFDNTIADNYVAGNGTFPPSGAGIGLFAPFSATLPSGTTIVTANYGNVVVGNTLVGNGLAGVALHTHSPGTEILKNDLVIGNRFSGNGGDSDVAGDNAPPNGISLLVVGGDVSGLVFSQNTFANESVDIAVKIVPADVSVTAQLNKFQANVVGIDNLLHGTINATENWWGCAQGPNAHAGCSTVSGSGVTVAPWLTNAVPTN